MSTDAVENLLHENRHFPPSASFAAQANAQPGLYGLADADRIKFWESQADRLSWHTKWQQALDWSGAPVAK